MLLTKKKIEWQGLEQPTRRLRSMDAKKIKVTTTKNKNELNLKASACRQEINIRSYATAVKKNKSQGQHLRPIQEVEV
jgi:hypothetical protein